MGVCKGMSRIVRSSKYRHVFGTAEKKENCFDGVHVSGGAWDTNKVAASNKFVACIWESQGGGSFAVLANENNGKLGSIPLVSGHKGKVLDINFSPFNDNLVASVSEDGNGRIWSIPDGGLTEHLVDPTQTLIGHKRKSLTLVSLNHLIDVTPFLTQENLILQSSNKTLIPHLVFLCHSMIMIPVFCSLLVKVMVTFVISKLKTPALTFITSVTINLLLHNLVCA